MCDMAKRENKMMRRRLFNSYVSTVISISLVLLLVGIASLLFANAERVSEYFKENMRVSVLFTQETGDDKAASYQEALNSLPAVKEVHIISKAQGIKEMSDMLGPDFLSVFETAPIPVSAELVLNADYVSADSLKLVEKEIMKISDVEEVAYQQSLVEALNANLGNISMMIGFFILLLLFISYVLISNTVRLNVFSHRFTIHTMKMVGATRAFIRKPYLIRSAFQGLLSAMVALLLLIGILFIVRSQFGTLFELFTLDVLLPVMGVVIASGLVICVVSTYFVVNKLVAFDKDDLYF